MFLHENINNCDDKMFILVDSISTLSIMNRSNLTPTFKNQIGHITQIKLKLEINLIQFEF